MIEEAPSILNTWIQDWNLLSESWRVGLVVFALVAGTAVVAYIASFIVGAVERRFQKPTTSGTTHCFTLRGSQWSRSSGCRVCIGRQRLLTTTRKPKSFQSIKPFCRLALFSCWSGRCFG